MADEEITLEETEEIANRRSVLKEKGPRPERRLMPLTVLEKRPKFINLSVKGQVKAYDRWRKHAIDRVEDPEAKARIDLVVRARVQEKLASRGVVGEAAQSLKQSFLGGKANLVRGTYGTVAHVARLASENLAEVFPGTNEEETRVALSSQGIINETDKRMDELIKEYNQLEKGTPGKPNPRGKEIIKSVRALGETKRKAEEALNPILDRTRTEGFLRDLTGFAGNSQRVADNAKASLAKLQNRFRKSDSFTEKHPYINAVASGAGELPAMVAQMLTGVGTVTLAMDLGQRAEDQARQIAPDITDGEAFAVRTLSGGVSIALNRLGFDTTIGKIFGKSSGLTGGQIAARHIVLKQAGKGTVAEGITEPTESIAVGEIIQAVTGENVDTLFTPEAFKERTVDAVAGGFLGTGTGLVAGLYLQKKKKPETKEPAAPEDSPPMADPEGPQTAPPLTPSEAANPAGTPPPEAPPLTTEDTEGPLGMAQSTDGKKNALVQFQSDRDKGLFDAYKRFVEGETTPEDLALIKDATDSGIDVSAFGKDIQAQIDGAEADSIISAPPPPVLSPELREASRRAEEETTSAPTSEEANVPRGTNEQPEAPTGPPLEPREVFRQVRKAIEGVPNVSAKIMEMPFGSGVTWTPSGNLQFTVTPSALQGKGDDPRFIMDEEVTHLAEVLGARDEWEAGGKEGKFQEFLDKRAREHAAGIDKELLDLRSADRKIAARALVESIRLYSRAGTDQNIDFAKLEQIAETGSVADVLAAARASGVAGSDASIYSEWLRQTDQLARTGTTTESAGETDSGVFARMTNLVDAIREAIRKSLEWIDRGRSVLQKSPTFTGDIDAITRKRQELSLPALSRPQTTQQTPPAAEVPRTPPEVVEREGTEGMPTEEAARVHRTSDPPPTPPLRPTPELGEGFVVGPRKSKIDEEREAWDLNPRDEFMSKTFKGEWPLAKERNMDGVEGSRLVNDLLENPRQITEEEIATLAHEMVRRRHELDRAMVDVNDPTKSEFQRKLSFNKFREAQVAYNRLADAIQNSSSRLGRAFNFLKMLVDDQFNLVTLKLTRQAGINGGDPLTPKQEKQIEGFYNRVQKLFRDLETAKNRRDSKTTNKAGREAAQKDINNIEFELAKEITKQLEKDNIERFKRLDAGRMTLAITTEIMSFPRALLTTVDFSATLRQGGIVAVSHPILASRAFEAQMKAFTSERGEFEVMQEIRNDPLHSVMVADGNLLYIGETTLAVTLDREQKARDEAYRSFLSTKIPGVKNFGRSYQTFLNKLRWDYYKDLVTKLSAATPEQRNGLAKWVNITTGRGGPGDMGEVAGFLGAMFFAPRWVASRFQYLATIPTIWTYPKGVRGLIAQEIGRQLLGFGGVISLFLLAKEAFDEDDEWGVEFDTRSSDFLKLRIGNTRHDFMAGLTQNIVMGSRVIRGQLKSPSTGEVKDADSWRTAATFLRTKLSPVVGTSFNVLSGKNVINQPAGLLDMEEIPFITNLTGTRAPSPLVNLFIPLTFGEISDAIEEQGLPVAIASSIATLLGAAGQTYEPGEGFGKTEGGARQLVEEYGFAGLIEELYTRSTEEGRLLLRAFDEGKPAIIEGLYPRLTPEEAGNPFGTTNEPANPFGTPRS